MLCSVVHKPLQSCVLTRVALYSLQTNRFPALLRAEQSGHIVVQTFLRDQDPESFRMGRRRGEKSKQKPGQLLQTDAFENGNNPGRVPEPVLLALHPHTTALALASGAQLSIYCPG